MIEYFTAGLNNPEISSRIRIEKPKTLAKAEDIAEIYEEMLRKNRSLISIIEYQTAPTYTPFESTIASPPSITSTQICDKFHMTNQGAKNTLASTRVKPRKVMFGSLDITGKEGGQRTLLLNNIAINNIADTGASISVISEDTALRVSQYEKP